MDQNLLDYLELNGHFETENSKKIKEQKCAELEKIAQKWVVVVAKNKNIVLDQEEKTVICSVFVQGSLALGVSYESSDVDIVLVVPKFIGYDDFFSSFVKTLSVNGIENIICVPETMVPIIKFTFNGISMDVVMCRLNSMSVPCPLDFNIPPEELYLGLDHSSVRSLSGVHVSRELRELVPNWPVFQMFLRAVRFWVSQRAIGHYVYGFPASIAWAIVVAFVCKKVDPNRLGDSWMHGNDVNSIENLMVLIAKMSLDKCIVCQNELAQDRDEHICNVVDQNQLNGVSTQNDKDSDLSQCNRNASAASKFSADHRSKSTLKSGDAASAKEIVTDMSNSPVALMRLFFAHFARWKWPQPVVISSIKVVPQLTISSWSMRNPQDERDLMPILGPVFPNKNMAFTVRPSTRDIVVREFKRGHQIMEDIIVGKSSWEKLYEKYNITNAFRHFVRLRLRTDDCEEERRVSGLMDARLRDFAFSLDSIQFVKSTRIVLVPNQSELSSKNTSSNPLKTDVTSTNLNKSNVNDSDEHNYSKCWLVGMDVEPPRVSSDKGITSNDAPKERYIDITAAVANFFQLLRDREPTVDFNACLKVDCVKRSQLKDWKL